MRPVEPVLHLPLGALGQDAPAVKDQRVEHLNSDMSGTVFYLVFCQHPWRARYKIQYGVTQPCADPHQLVFEAPARWKCQIARWRCSSSCSTSIPQPSEHEARTEKCNRQTAAAAILLAALLVPLPWRHALWHRRLPACAAASAPICHQGVSCSTLSVILFSAPVQSRSCALAPTTSFMCDSSAHLSIIK